MTPTLHYAIPQPKRGSQWLAPVAIIALTLLAYFPAVHAKFIWDDDAHITQNRLLLDADGLGTMWTKFDALPQYYPLTHSFFWIEHHLWGNNPMGYHLVNIFVHVINALLVWVMLRRLLIPGAGLAAILFAVHPVNVETVAWVTEGKNTFSALFYLLSLWAYSHTSFFKVGVTHRKSDGQWYALSFAFFVCALLCKTVSASLPAAILLLVYLQAGRIRIRNVLPLIPYFLVGLLLSINTAYLERTHVKAVGADWTFASSRSGEIVARCLIAGRAVWFYLAKLFVPLRLSFEYPRWHIDVMTVWQYLFPLAVITLLLSLFWMRNFLGRGALVGALFFVGTLVPALGFNNIFPMRYSLVADHFQYLASLGPLTLLAACIACALQKWMGDAPEDDSIPSMRDVLVAPAVVVLVMLTWFRSTTFQDSQTLYADVISKNPNAWMSCGNLGSIYLDKGDLNRAQAYMDRSLALHHNNPIIATRRAQIYMRRNEPELAIAAYQYAIGVDPNYAESHFELAEALQKLNNIPEALKQYDKAITIQPKHAPALLAYGTLLAQLNEYAAAAQQLGKAVEIDPRSKTARRAYLAALERSDQFDKAAEQLTILLNNDPKDPAVLYRDLGLVELARHRPEPAAQAFQKSLEINPDQPDVRQRLGELIHQLMSTTP